uniref:Mos1 transposase HTH domain-containing protein n=1 Tax=Cuerna arida TaxID=1464854 RepID=A0A1B6ERR1_9HEMI
MHYIRVLYISSRLFPLLLIFFFLEFSSASVAGRKKTKLKDVDVGVKQRVVKHFLTKEKVIPDEIERRLKDVFGNETRDVRDVAGSEERLSWTLDSRSQERVIIQFLTAEGAGPKEVFERLRAVFGKSLPLSTIQRWSRQFRAGRTSVGDLPRNSNLPHTSTK